MQIKKFEENEGFNSEIFKVTAYDSSNNPHYMILKIPCVDKFLEKLEDAGQEVNESDGVNNEVCIYFASILLITNSPSRNFVFIYDLRISTASNASSPYYQYTLLILVGRTHLKDTSLLLQNYHLTNSKKKVKKSKIEL